MISSLNFFALKLTFVSAFPEIFVPSTLYVPIDRRPRLDGFLFTIQQKEFGIGNWELGKIIPLYGKKQNQMNQNLIILYWR